MLRWAGVLSCLASCNEQGKFWPWNCEKGGGSVNVLERKGPTPPGPTLLKPTPSAHLPYCPDCFSFLNKLSFLISNSCPWTQEPGISGPSECRSVVQRWAYPSFSFSSAPVHALTKGLSMLPLPFPEAIPFHHTAACRETCQLLWTPSQKAWLSVPQDRNYPDLQLLALLFLSHIHKFIP